MPPQGPLRLSGVGALWDCVSRVCGGGGGCAGGGVPLGTVPALSWCGDVSLGGIHIISSPHTPFLVSPYPLRCLPISPCFGSPCPLRYPPLPPSLSPHTPFVGSPYPLSLPPHTPLFVSPYPLRWLPIPPPSRRPLHPSSPCSPTLATSIYKYI